MNRTISTTVSLALAALVAASCTPAQADALARTANRLGGVITLTDIACDDEKGTNIAYSTGKYGEDTIFGCWFYSKPDVMIKWRSGNITTIPVGAFELVEKPDQPSQPARQPARTY